VSVVVLACTQGALAPSQARAASAPSATTGPAQDVSFDSATVTGTVDPNASAASYYFEYGPTAAYGTETSAASAGAGAAAVAVHAPLSGLAPSSSYHYRLVVLSAGGTVVGSDLSFKTSKTPAPTAITRAAASVSSSTALLEGAVDPGGVDTTYYFQYGTSSAYGNTTPVRSAGSGTSSTAVSEPLSGLQARTTYHYRLVAVSAGATVMGAGLTLTTTGSPLPTVATGGASMVGTTTATLDGTVDPGGVPTTYYFEYGTKSPTTRTPSASAGAGTASVAVSVRLSGLAPASKYFYRLVAVGAGTRIGATRSFTTAKIVPSLTLTSTANPVGAGANVTFEGVLAGSGIGVRTVALEIEPYPYSGGFVQVGAAELTSATGAYSFTLPNLAINTIARAVTLGGSPSLVSPVVLEQVFVRVSVRVRRHNGALHISGLIAPGGAPVLIHIQRRLRGRWVTVARTATHPLIAGLAAYARTLGPPRRGRYRVLALMQEGSLLSGHSRVVYVS
jgi:hypothetical protein